MKKIFAILAMATVTATTNAETWTLDSCINYAVEHNLTVRQRQISELSAEQQITEAKSRYLPNVSASAQQSWNLGRGLTAENTYANRNTSNFGWSGSFNLPIFSGLSTERQISYAKANLQQVIEQCEAAKEDITINVITAYLQVLYTMELQEVARQQVALSSYELSRQQALLEAGKIPEVDLLEAKAQLAADELSLTQSGNDLILAKIDLIQLLELRVEASQFNVSPLLGTNAILPEPEEAYARALQYNHTIAAAQRGINVSEHSISVAKAGYIPTLSFGAGLGSSYYKLSGFENESFSDQMKHNYSTYFGFSLSIPIFDAFSTRNSVRRAKVEKINAELQLDMAEQQLYRTIQQAYYQASGAKEKLASSLIAEEAASQAFNAMQEKYNIGRATPTEYEQAKTKALRATAERIQANYELRLRTRLLEYYSTPH